MRWGWGPFGLSRYFRFVRFDEALQPLEELRLRCLDAADALLIGGRLGWRVEVWDGARPLGVVGEGAVAASPNLATLSTAIQPMALPPTPPAYQTQPAVQRPYNPFRKGAWQRRSPG